MAIVSITSVDYRPSGFYLITDAAGQRYMTKNSWLAALADRFREKQTSVEVFSSGGWYYRDLWAIRDPLASAPEPTQIICAWCSRVLTPGSQPASHGICPTCEAKAHAELDAKTGKSR